MLTREVWLKNKEANAAVSGTRQYAMVMVKLLVKWRAIGYVIPLIYTLDDEGRLSKPQLI